MHGLRGGMVAGGVCGCEGHAWLQGACMVAGGHAWLWGGCGYRGHVWQQGGCGCGGCAWLHGGMRGGKGAWDMTRYGQCAGGTHPTKMHSCYPTNFILEPVIVIFK